MTAEKEKAEANTPKSEIGKAIGLMREPQARKPVIAEAKKTVAQTAAKNFFME